jgi:tRNA-Thr(GGU) m(6)t(6)A37 methyltransferase TsaA
LIASTCDDDSMDRTYSVVPVAVVASSRTEVVDDGWDDVTTTISLLPPFTAEALRGLRDFSHVEVIYLFDRVDPDAVHTGSRRPRGNPDWPEVGVFAQRVKNRSNRIGLSTCEVLGVHDTVIRVRGLDAVDDTPVLDLKPYMEEFGPRTAVRQPPWSRDLMAGYY